MHCPEYDAYNNVKCPSCHLYMSASVTLWPLLYYRTFTEAAAESLLSREVRPPLLNTQVTIINYIIYHGVHSLVLYLEESLPRQAEYLGSM